MTDYVTTNIRLPRAMHERLKRRAVEESKSLAQVVRESLVEYLAAPETQGAMREDGSDDPIFAIAQLTRPNEVIGGDRPTDTSVRHDLYLYGNDLDDGPEAGVIDA